MAQSDVDAALTVLSHDVEVYREEPRVHSVWSQTLPCFQGSHFAPEDERNPETISSTLDARVSLAFEIVQQLRSSICNTCSHVSIEVQLSR